MSFRTARLPAWEKFEAGTFSWNLNCFISSGKNCPPLEEAPPARLAAGELGSLAEIEMGKLASIALSHRRAKSVGGGNAVSGVEMTFDFVQPSVFRSPINSNRAFGMTGFLMVNRGARAALA